MKKVLLVAGVAFVILVVALAALISYGVYQGRGLDASSKAYIEENVPPIISAWSKEELLRRSSPQLLRVIQENPRRLDELFQKLSRLGALKSFDEVNGDSQILYDTTGGRTITAAYTADARFEHGEARMSIRLIRNNAQWRFLAFNVSSPLFLQ